MNKNNKYDIEYILDNYSGTEDALEEYSRLLGEIGYPNSVTEVKYRTMYREKYINLVDLAFYLESNINTNFGKCSYKRTNNNVLNYLLKTVIDLIKDYYLTKQSYQSELINLSNVNLLFYSVVVDYTRNKDNLISIFDKEKESIIS